MFPTSRNRPRWMVTGYRDIRAEVPRCRVFVGSWRVCLGDVFDVARRSSVGVTSHRVV